jgi:3-hydroxyacyl-[acyl-carrier-protein] dehydratase
MDFSVIDRIAAWEPGGWIRAEKYLRADECFLPDHFPGTPVMPGVLILEAMAQAGDWLIQRGRRESPGRFCLRALRAVKFARFVQPEETLVISAILVGENADGAELACQATVDDCAVASARMTLASRDSYPSYSSNAEDDVLGVLLSSDLSRRVNGPPNCAELVGRAAGATAANAGAGFRWIWLDRFVEFHSGRSARALKQVPYVRQDYSLGHLFPEQLTAALVLEGLAQTGGLLAFDALGFRKSPIMAKVTKAEFCGEPEPGAVLEYSAVLEHLDEEGAAVCTASRCGEYLHAQAHILFAFLGDDRGNMRVDPAAFFTMLCNAKALDVLPEPQLASVAVT